MTIAKQKIQEDFPMKANWFRLASAIGFALTILASSTSFAMDAPKPNPAATKFEQKQALAQYKDRLSRARLATHSIGFGARFAYGYNDVVSPLREAKKLRAAYVKQYGKDVGFVSRLMQKYVEAKLRHKYPGDPID